MLSFVFAETFLENYGARKLYKNVNLWTIYWTKSVEWLMSYVQENGFEVPWTKIFHISWEV